jgi:hypothetical protein
MQSCRVCVAYFTVLQIDKVLPLQIYTKLHGVITKNIVLPSLLAFHCCRIQQGCEEGFSVPHRSFFTPQKTHSPQAHLTFQSHSGLEYASPHFPCGRNGHKKKLNGLSPRANYTDRATAASRRSGCQLLRIKDATWST